MAETQITLYEMAKQMVANETPMDPIQFNIEMKTVAEKICLGLNNYYFLICPDLRQYVMFHLNIGNSTFESVQKEISETLLNRGSILLIDKEKENENIWEFWIKDIYDESIYMYQLVPYEVLEM